jgi:hypothetical protein
MIRAENVIFEGSIVVAAGSIDESCAAMTHFTKANERLKIAILCQRISLKQILRIHRLHIES